MSPPRPSRKGFLEPLLFVVGNPLSHSLSPAMHNGVIARRRLPLRYIGVEIPPEVFPDFLRVVRAGNFLGGNVTIPYKERAAELADLRSEAVRFCGAANVLVAQRGRLAAENTDGPGFFAALAGAGWGRRFGRAVLLGAGGAARGVAYEMGRAGTRDLVILNRDPVRAARVAADLGPLFPRMRIETGRLSPAAMKRRFPGAELVVQCTSLGLSREWDAFPLEAVAPGTRVADLVYRPGGTKLVRELRKRGVPAIDGLSMLAAQAALSFALWTGIRVPAARFLEGARAARGGPAGREE